MRSDAEKARFRRPSGLFPGQSDDLDEDWRLRLVREHLPGHDVGRIRNGQAEDSTRVAAEWTEEEKLEKLVANWRGASRKGKEEAEPRPADYPEGDSGDAVRRLQRAIRRVPRPDFLVDGVFGPATRRAVVEFQQENGLSVDGVVGHAAWHALADGGPIPVLAEGSNGQIVRNLQTFSPFAGARTGSSSRVLVSAQDGLRRTRCSDGIGVPARHLPGAVLVPKDGGDANGHRGDFGRSAHPRPVALDLDDVGEVGGDNCRDVRAGLAGSAGTFQGTVKSRHGMLTQVAFATGAAVGRQWRVGAFRLGAMDDGRRSRVSLNALLAAVEAAPPVAAVDGSPPNWRRRSAPVRSAS